MQRQQFSLIFPFFQAIILFSSAVYLLSVPAWFMQGRILNADGLVPLEAVFCTILSGALFGWFLATINKIRRSVKNEK